MAIVSITGTPPADMAGSYGARASRSGKYFAANGGSSGHKARVVEVLSDGSFSQRNIDPTADFAGQVMDTAVSAGGTYLCLVASSTSDPPKILKWNPTTSQYEALTTLAGVTSSYQTACDFSEDNNYLAIGYYTGVQIYQRSGDTFTLVSTIPNDATHLNGVSIEDVKWSFNGQYIAVGHRSGVQVYRTDTLARVLRSEAGQSMAGWNVAWSLDDAYLFSTAQLVGGGFYGYSRSGDTFTGLNSWNPIWSSSVQIAGPVAPFKIGSDEYVMVIAQGETSSANVRCYTRASGYLSYVTLASLGFPAFTGTQSYSLGNGTDTNGAQYIYSVKASGTSVQAWRIDPARSDVEGAITFPKAQLDGLLSLQLTASSDTTFPVSSFFAALALEESAPDMSFEARPIYRTVVAGPSDIEQATAPPFIFGGIDFPKMRLDGAVVVGRGLWGDIDFPMMQIAGTLQAEPALWGDIDFPMTQIAGSLLNGRIVNGDIDFPVMELEGQIEPSPQVDGDIDFPVSEINGALGVLIQVNGEIDFPVLEIEAAALNGFRLESDIDFPLTEIDGAVDQSHRFFGDIDFPMVEVAGGLEQDRALSGDIGFPMTLHESAAALRYNIDSNVTFRAMQLDGIVKMIAGLLGDIDFPMTQIAGVIRPRLNAESDIDFPAAELDGFVKLINFAEGDIDFPVSETDGAFEQERALSGDIDFPMGEIAAVLHFGYDVSSDIDFPVTEHTGFVKLINFAEGDIDFPVSEIDGAFDQERALSGDIDFPAGEIEGFLDWDTVVSGDIAFPMMQLDGTLHLRAFVTGGTDFPKTELAGMLRLRVNGQGSITFPLMQPDGYLFVGAPPEPGDGGTGMWTSGGTTLGAPSFRFGQNNKTRIG